MAVEWEVTPASPRAGTDFAHILVTGVDDHVGSNGIDEDPTIRYRIHATGPSGQVLKSHEFTPTPGGDGTHQWDTVAFDEEGSWELALIDLADDSEVDTEALTVAASS